MMFLRMFLALLVFSVAVGAAELPRVEREVAVAVKSSKVTVVHFWNPSSPQCQAELTRIGWSALIDLNAEVNFVFVTVWQGEDGDGHALLERNGIAAQKNFELFAHPNSSRKPEDRVAMFLGLPVTWVPTTWIFRDGQLRYALNYGELRFPLLQQLIRDAAEKWEH